MAESKVHRIVQTDRLQLEEPEVGQTYRFYDYSITAPPGYRVHSHDLWFAEDNQIAAVAECVSYGPVIQDTNSDGVLDRVYHRVARTATSAGEFFFRTIFERSDEPDVILYNNSI
jgi:hypothetical protein